MRSAPSLSVVIVALPGPRQPMPLACVREVIAVVPPSVSYDAADFGATPTRWVHADAPAGQRANIGISLASGDWVMVLNGSEHLAGDWIDQLGEMLAGGAVCAHRILPTRGGSPLLVAWRAAFAYGALDGRIDDCVAAMEHWLSDIFPSHGHRVLPREGSATHQADWLMTDAARVGATSTVGRIPRTDGDYDPRRFWEDGGRGWVKWEAYQPDEPEIRAIVARTHPDRVLELGCGGGRNGRYFESATRYAGLDISLPLLDRARDRRAENCIGLVCGDAVQLPFADASFDLVFAVSTLQHIVRERIVTCAADILRVARRYICMIEFTEELQNEETWFSQPHMFRHDYPALFSSHAALLLRRPTTLQIQPALKEVFLFEKRWP
jgi:SAM-dependent methyltransferase